MSYLAVSLKLNKLIKTNSSNFTDEGFVILLKPGKNVRKTTSSRPIILKSAWRKGVSLIALQRTEKI